MLNQLCWGGSEVICYYGPMLRVSQIRLYFGRRKIGCTLIRASVACSRLSDSGETREKLAGREKRKGKGKEFSPVLFSCLRFLNSADPLSWSLEQASANVKSHDFVCS